MLDVKDFGAKGDGIVDDTVAIQTAINSGNEIFISFGTYLISSSLTLKSDIIITGYGTIKINSDGPGGTGVKAFSSGTTGIQNVQIIGITIDGGGQVGNVNTGKKAGVGIYLTNVTNVLIDRVHIKNCGIVNSAAPQTDANFGGYGILANCNSGKVKDLKIINCTIEYIAGGGVNTGDGIDVNGYNASLSITPEDILISNCSINYVGRNGISLAGGEGSTSLSKNIRVINNYISNTQLAGIDIEQGGDIIISDCQFYKCGNITNNYYYSYPALFPVTYTLRSAITTGTDSDNILISDTIISDCNMGIAYGSMLNKISNVHVSNSTTTDITQAFSGNGGTLIITNSEFTSTQDIFSYSSGNNSIKASNCIFSGAISILILKSGTFSQCTFKKGIKFINPTSSNITWDNCDFLGSGTGTGIDVAPGTTVSMLLKNCIVSNCRFSNLDIGILSGTNNVIGWVIEGNIFTNITTYGIRQVNAGGAFAFRSISNNQFINSASPISTSISIVQASVRININDNYFEAIATCISITNINSGLDLLDATINGNLAVGCTNGLAIGLSTGNWNRCIVTYNNFFGCSGAKISLPGVGNAAGFISNNIV